MNIAETVERIITEDIPDKDVALLYSGGIDSTFVGLAAVKAGKRVHSFTFVWEPLSGDEKPYVETGEANAEKLGFASHTRCVLNDDNIKDYVHKTTKVCVKKHDVIHFGAAHYICFEKAKDYNYMLTGVGVDINYMLTNHFAHDIMDISLAETQAYKRKRQVYFNRKKPYSRFWHENAIVDIAKHFDIKLVEPFMYKEIHSFYWGMTQKEASTPFPKHHIRNAYEEFNQLPEFPVHTTWNEICGVYPKLNSLGDLKYGCR